MAANGRANVLRTQGEPLGREGREIAKHVLHPHTVGLRAADRKLATPRSDLDAEGALDQFEVLVVGTEENAETFLG